MNIWLTYIIKELILPPSSLILLSAFGLYKQFTKKNGLRLILFSITSLYILSISIVSSFLASTIETTPHFSVADINNRYYQAIVILGGGLRENSREYGNDLTVNYRTLERVRYGAKLSKETGLPILVSGGRVFHTDEPSEAEIMAKTLEDFNIQAHWQESNSKNTAENARQSYQLLKNFHINRIILVTHAFHMPRALIEFKKAGFDVLPAPTARLQTPRKITIFSFIPKAESLKTSSLILHEYIGLIWYKFKS